VLSRFNPLAYLVDVARAVFRNDLSGRSLLTATAVLAGMTVLSVWWGTRTYQRENG
jgi:ABC-2 type transport system permease protein